MTMRKELIDELVASHIRRTRGDAGWEITITLKSMDNGFLKVAPGPPHGVGGWAPFDAFEFLNMVAAEFFRQADSRRRRVA